MDRRTFFCTLAAPVAAGLAAGCNKNPFYQEGAEPQYAEQLNRRLAMGMVCVEGGFLPIWYNFRGVSIGTVGIHPETSSADLNINGVVRSFGVGDAYVSEESIIALLEEIKLLEDIDAHGNVKGPTPIYRIASGDFYDARGYRVGDEHQFRFRFEDGAPVSVTLDDIAGSNAEVRMGSGAEKLALLLGKPYNVSGIRKYGSLELYVANVKDDRADIILFRPAFL